jgi:hypothetical protein
MDRGARVAGGRKFITVLGQKVHCDPEQNPADAARDRNVGVVRQRSGENEKRREHVKTCDVS